MLDDWLRKKGGLAVRMIIYVVGKWGLKEKDREGREREKKKREVVVMITNRALCGEACRVNRIIPLSLHQRMRAARETEKRSMYMVMSLKSILKSLFEIHL